MNCMLVLVVFVAFVESSCDAVTWKNYKDKEYALVADKMDWINAQRYCSKLGGSLAHAETSDVNSFLISMTDRSTRLWLGGSNIYDKKMWEWQSPVKPITHDYWGNGEPNRQNIENCMFYWKSSQGYKWGNNICDAHKYGFLCQRQKKRDNTCPKSDGCDLSQNCNKKCMTICL